MRDEEISLRGVLLTVAALVLSVVVAGGLMSCSVTTRGPDIQVEYGAFMEACMADRADYECDTMWGQGHPRSGEPRRIFMGPVGVEP